jgi:hypothetical protein
MSHKYFIVNHFTFLRFALTATISTVKSNTDAVIPAMGTIKAGSSFSHQVFVGGSGSSGGV